MADSSKRLWFKQAIVKAVFLHLYRRHFKKVHWCYLSTKSANVPENIIPQAYCTGPVQCSLFSLRNTWQSGPFLLLLVPCSNVISRLWQPMLKVEKKQHKQTSIVRFTEFFQICRGVHRVVLRVLQHPHPGSGAPAPYPDSEKLK